MAYRRNDRLPAQACPECAQSFKPHDARQLFCNVAHRRKWEKRIAGAMSTFGLHAMAWRQGRHTKDKIKKEVAKDAFTELCLALDRLNADAKASGRIGALDYLTMRYRRDGLITPVSSEPAPLRPARADQLR